MAPKQHLLDSTYDDADVLVNSRQEHGIIIAGPTRKNVSWLAPEIFDLAGNVRFFLELNSTRLKLAKSFPAKEGFSSTNRLFQWWIVIIIFVLSACSSQIGPAAIPRSTLAAEQGSPLPEPTISSAPTQTLPPPSLPITATSASEEIAKPSDDAASEPGQVEVEEKSPSFTTISADEQWIVTQPHRQHLVLVRPDGTEPIDILTHLPHEQFHPDWSPDGSQLAFEHTPEGPDTDVREIWVSNANGDNARPLVTTYPADLGGLWWANPAWSRDGRAIVIAGYEGNASFVLPPRSVIAIIEVASGEISVVSDVLQSSGVLQSFPRWSPDGNSLVISVDKFEGEEFIGQAIAVIRRDDSGWSTPNIITPTDGFEDFATRPDWNLSDDLIVFSTNDRDTFFETDKPSNLYTIRPDGTDLTAVTTFGPGEDRASQPTWTLDGRIIFTYITGAADEQQSIAFINADGSGLEILAGLENLVHSRLRPVP